MAGVTQHRPHDAIAGRRFGSFASKTNDPGSGHPVGVLTQHVTGVMSGQRYGSFASKTGGGTPPTAPTTVVGTTTGSTTATITWVDASSDETGFQVQVRTASGPGAWGDAAGATNPTAAGVQTFAATGLTAATAYDAQVRAKGASADSAYVQTSASFTTDNSGSGGGAIGIQVPLGTLALAGYAPTIYNPGPVTITVPLGTLTLTGYAPTVVSTVPSTGAGRSRRSRTYARPVVVSVDGEDIIVGSEAEAVEILDKAREAAQEIAEKVTARAIVATNRPKRKVMADARKALQPPSIVVPPVLQAEADRVLTDIAAIYNAAIQSVEIGALLRRAEDEDDEDVLLLML